MPELPDVEVFRQYMASTAFHKKISAATVFSKEMLESVSAPQLKKMLEGRTLESGLRHGKYLFTETSNGPWLVLHFGMTGFLKYFKDPDHQPSHTRLLLDFANGYHLAYDCQRKLGMMSLTDAPGDFIRKSQLGPDALDPDLDVDQFEQMVKGTSATIKSTLMNQNRIAGIGNIYSDEMLFQAGIHPGAKSQDLGKTEIKRLYGELKKVLQKAIEARADPNRFPDSFIIPHRRTDRVCPKCSGDIEKAKIGGRTAYYCPRCQQK